MLCTKHLWADLANCIVIWAFIGFYTSFLKLSLKCFSWGMSKAWRGCALETTFWKFLFWASSFSMADLERRDLAYKFSFDFECLPFIVKLQITNIKYNSNINSLSLTSCSQSSFFCTGFLSLLLAVLYYSWFNLICYVSFCQICLS